MAKFLGILITNVTRALVLLAVIMVVAYWIGVIAK